jgi:hypothetical protein
LKRTTKGLEFDRKKNQQVRRQPHEEQRNQKKKKKKNEKEKFFCKVNKRMKGLKAHRRGRKDVVNSKDRAVLSCLGTLIVQLRNPQII